MTVTDDPIQFQADPPDDDTCRDCYEWRRYPEGQEHFGYAWFLRCRYSRGGCEFKHEGGHHEDELWIGQT